jgi:predicted nucleic acid-binding protein
MPSEGPFRGLVIDTSVIVGALRKRWSAQTWSGVLLGRRPVLSPVTLHELRRGVKPGSPWEGRIDELAPAEAIIADPPSRQEWLDAADILRERFFTRGKLERAALQNDVLVALAAKRIGAELWATDGDFKAICEALELPLISIGSSAP